MRLSDKMTQTRHNVDEIFDSLDNGITSALNEMFEYGAEAEKTRIINLLEAAEAQALKGIDSAFTASAQTKFVWQADTYNKAIALIKGEK